MVEIKLKLSEKINNLRVRISYLECLQEVIDTGGISNSPIDESNLSSLSGADWDLNKWDKGYIDLYDAKE